MVKDNEKVGESTDCISGRVEEIREIWGLRGSEQERRGLSDAYNGDFGVGTDVVLCE